MASDDAAVSRPPKRTYPEDFERFWKLYPRTKDGSKVDTFRNWERNLRQGVTPTEMIEGAQRYAAKCTAERSEQRYIKQPSTFLGPGRWWEAEYEVAQVAKALGKGSPEAELLAYYELEPLR